MEDLLEKNLKAVNIGLREFFDSLIEQNVEAVQVEWKPPAQGDEELLEILDEVL